MATTKYQDRLAMLEQSIETTLEMGVRQRGETNSRDYSDEVIKLPENLMYNVDGSSDYIIEVSDSAFYSNNGQIYGYDCVTLEQLAEIADYVDNYGR
jgi:hypothetical protein